MKRALLVVPLLALAGCGGLTAERNPGHDARHGIAALGLALELPPGWNARTVLGAEGRPVLHAASFPLPSNDDDTGEVAQETIGGRGQMYVNVRDLGLGETGSALPAQFRPPISDLRLPGPEAAAASSRSQAATSPPPAMSIASPSPRARTSRLPPPRSPR